MKGRASELKKSAIPDINECRIKDGLPSKIFAFLQGMGSITDLFGSNSIRYSKEISGLPKNKREQIEEILLKTEKYS